MNNRELKQEARRLLDGASYDPKKLTLIYAGVSTGLMLVLTVLQYVLSRQIADTGGLAGLGMRSVLSTAVSVLQLAGNILLPFWSMGFVYAMLRIVRQQQAGPESLPEGFRRFGPVLRLMLIRGMIYTAILLLSVYPSMMLFLMTPLSDPLVALLEPLVAAGTVDAAALMADAAVMEAVNNAMLPMVAFNLVVFGLLAMPIFYRFRMAEYALLDDPRAGALRAMGRSTMLMRGKLPALLKLDLSYWWFYLLQAAVTVLCFGDTILPMLGVAVPVSAEVLYFVCYGLYLAAQFVLCWTVQYRVDATYALVYARMTKDSEAEA